MNNELVFYRIYESDIQSVALSVLGRELTDKELKRLPTAFTDSTDFFDQLSGALTAVTVMVTQKESWEETDKRFKNVSLDELLNQGYEENN